MCQGTLFNVCCRLTSRPSYSIFGFLNFCFDQEKKNNIAEFKVHLIHRKQVPLLHNTVLILCNEGAGSVAVSALMDSSFSFETVNLGWSILYIEGSLVIISK